MATILAVHLNYGHEVLELAEHKAIFMSDGKKVETSFDLLVGADGAESRVRKSAGLSYLPQSKFSVLGKELEISGLKQTTVILSFKSGEHGACPSVAVDSEGNKVSPEYPRFFVPGVTSVFKRFFDNHCHLQILLEREVGDKVYSDFKNGGILPWQLILNVSNVILEEKIETIEQVHSLVGLDEQGKPDVNVFDIIIKKTDKSTLLLPGKDRVAVVTLAGDSTITAHYRLGIGINNAFIALLDFREFLRDLCPLYDKKALMFSPKDLPAVSAVVEEKVEADERRMRDMTQAQLSTIFLESYCGYTVNLYPRLTSWAHVAEEEVEEDEDDDGFDLLERKGHERPVKERERFHLVQEVSLIKTPTGPSLTIPDYSLLVQNCEYLKSTVTLH